MHPEQIHLHTRRLASCTDVSIQSFIVTKHCRGSIMTNPERLLQKDATHYIYEKDGKGMPINLEIGPEGISAQAQATILGTGIGLGLGKTETKMHAFSMDQVKKAIADLLKRKPETLPPIEELCKVDLLYSAIEEATNNLLQQTRDEGKGALSADEYRNFYERLERFIWIISPELADLLVILAPFREIYDSSEESVKLGEIAGAENQAKQYHGLYKKI
jgi:hypothetical protein